MASDGSSAGPSASGESPRSLTDLKGIVKESLRELLHEEPALFASRTDRRPPGSSGEDAAGGKYRSREVLCPGLEYLGLGGRAKGTCTKPTERRTGPGVSVRLFPCLCDHVERQVRER